MLTLDKQLSGVTETATSSTAHQNTSSLTLDRSPQISKKPLSKPTPGLSTTRTLGNSPQNQTSLSGMFRVKKRGIGEVKTVGESSRYQSTTPGSSTRPGKL